MKLLIYLAVGGVLGTWSRFGLQGLAQPATGTFPWGTLAVNLLGSFALGFLMSYLVGSNVASPELRAGLTIGFCGAFTTMSTFAYETATLTGGNEYWKALFYLFGTTLGCLTMVEIGQALGRRLL